jgi:hypothetical protein
MISIILPYLFGIAEEAPSILIPRTKKRAGELAEAFFLSNAESLNFHVSKPWGDSNRYDFIVDCGQTLSRVQLKCTSTISYRAYQIIPVCNLNGRHIRLYTPEEIDFIVCYIVPKAIWYVIPIAALEGAKTLRFYPDIPCRNPRWEKYREAWHLMRGPQIAP